MKKLILSAAIVLGSLTAMNAQAQEENATPAEQPAQTEQAAPAQEAAPAEQATQAEQSAPASDAYTEIKTEEVPAAVAEALKKAYPVLSYQLIIALPFVELYQVPVIPSLRYKDLLEVIKEFFVGA